LTNCILTSYQILQERIVEMLLYKTRYDENSYNADKPMQIKAKTSVHQITDYWEGNT